MLSWPPDARSCLVPARCSGDRVPIVRVDVAADSRIDDFRELADTRRLAARQLFLAEGRLVVTQLLTESPLGVEAVLVNHAAYEALTPVLDTRPDVMVFVVPAAIVEPLTGFNIHRGCLATGRRPAPVTTADLLAGGARRFLVLEGVSNPDNVGGLFRTARALGVDAVILGPGTGDPLYRKAIRVSSGASLVLPFGTAVWPDGLHELRAAGVPVLALTPAGPETIDEVRQRLGRPAAFAVLVGSEGHGLSPDALDAADARIRIPIDTRADSLNVTVAAGIALHALR